MKVSKLFALILLVDCSALALLAYFFVKPVSYVEYEGDGFRCLVPAGVADLTFDEFGWHKHHFSSKGQIYISHYSLPGTFEEELEKLGKHLHGAAYQQEVKVFDNGWFFLFARGRSWRKYIYLFSCEKEIFWVENMTPSSTLLIYKEIADKIVTTMRIDGQTPDPMLPEAIAGINKKIIRYSQSTTVFFGFMMLLLGLTTLLLPAGLIYLGGATPALDERAIIRKERRVYVVIRAPGKYKGTFCTLVLTTEGLALYSFKRTLMSISKGERSAISLAQHKEKSFLLVQLGDQTFRIYVTDPLLWMNDIEARSMV